MNKLALASTPHDKEHGTSSADVYLVSTSPTSHPWPGASYRIVLSMGGYASLRSLPFYKCIDHIPSVIKRLEMTEMFFDGKTIVSRDFRVSELHKGGKTETFKTSGQEMGYAQELKAFVDCVGGKTVADVSTTEMFSTMDVIFAIELSLATGQAVLTSTKRMMSA